MKEDTIEIIAPSRLHITLIDLNGALGRVDGSVGLTLDSPSMRIKVQRDEGVSVSGSDVFAHRIEHVIQAMAAEHKTGGAAIQVIEEYRSHVGLGAGTQVALAVATGISQLYGLDLELNELARLTGRGGTSGIGVAAYESGGFIVDGGHKNKAAFLPSSASQAYSPAPVLVRYEFPEWSIVLAIPDLQGASDKPEVTIFQQQCPIPLNEVQALCHVVLMEMLPAVVEKDIGRFGRSINHVQTLGFKRRELALQPFCKRLIDLMNENGALGAGMSSFGPTVYAISDEKQLKPTVQRFLNESVGGEVLLVKARNEGARVTHLR
ncbi:MAG: beta-ribofuranosylaminobenzene 5'-phosphate synthase [Halobacteriota archaeon]